MLDRFLTRLAYSRLMDPSWLLRRIIACYCLLAVACVVYLLGAPVIVIALACIPGAAIFLVGINVFAYRFGIETILPLLNGFGR